MRRIAILLPAYNEEQTIRETMQAFFNELPDAAIYVINNNSKDATREIALSTLRDLGAKGAVLDEYRQGKGNAVRRGFLSIDADVYVLVDADMTYPADQVHELLRPVLEGHADMVVGDRHSRGDYRRENKRPLHDIGNRLVQGLVNAISGADLIDIMSGYRVFNRSFVQSYPILVSGFQTETDMSLFAAQNRFRVQEVPIRYIDRPEGSESKLNTMPDGIRVIITILNIFRCYRPLLFFSIFSVLFLLLGLLCGYPVIDEWLKTSYVSHLPLAILAVGLCIFSIILLGIGLTLDAVVYHRRLEIEQTIMRHSVRKYAE